MTLRRDELRELQYITPIDNITSIIKNGILSHKNATRVKHTSCAKQEIQDRRSEVIVPSGKPLHWYVNLYFDARNPMLHLLKDDHETLCVLAIDQLVIDLPGAVIVDCNASREYALFKPTSSGLAMIEKDLVYAEYWTHDDPVDQYYHKGAKCAEVLIPERVDAKFILKAYISCNSSKVDLLSRLEESNLELQTIVDGHLFFH
jgi:hypothetical protein